MEDERGACWAKVQLLRVPFLYEKPASSEDASPVQVSFDDDCHYALLVGDLWSIVSKGRI